jgi:choline monooxygenase
VLRTDRAQILRRTWQFIGHEAMVPNRGDYLAEEIGGAPVVVVRKADGDLAAFHNVCRHRAGALVADGEGNCGEAFTCRYHGWRYALDGRLRAATDFGAAPGFDPRQYGLFPIRVETWGGLVFVNLDLAAAPLAETLGPSGANRRASVLPADRTAKPRHRLQLEDLRRELPRGLPPADGPPGVR